MQPFTITLTSDRATVAPAESATLTATVNQSVTPTNYSIEILDEASGYSVGYCYSGTTCQATVGRSTAGTSRYVAVVAPYYSGPLPADQTQAQSDSVAVAMQPFTVTLDRTATAVTATANQSVGPTPYSILIYDGLGQLITYCGGGTQCTAQTTSGANAVAYIAPYSSSIPTEQVQAVSTAPPARPSYSVQLVQSAAQAAPTASVTLTATANADLRPGYEYLAFYDADSGRLLDFCLSGGACTTRVRMLGSESRRIVADVVAGSPADATSGGPLASSDVAQVDSTPFQVTVTPAADSNDRMYVQAHANQPVDGTGLQIQIYDRHSGRLLNNCPSGTDCKATPPPDMWDFAAYVAPLSLTAPSTSLATANLNVPADHTESQMYALDGPAASGGQPVAGVPEGPTLTPDQTIDPDPATLPVSELPPGVSVYEPGGDDGLRARTRVAPTSPGSHLRPQAVGNSDATEDSCSNDPAAKGGDGRVVDHFDYCQWQDFVLYHRVCHTAVFFFRTCEQAAEATWRLTVVGHGYNRDRHVDFTDRVDQVVFMPGVETAELTVRMNCYSRSSTDCVGTQALPVSDSLEDWQQDPYINFRFDSPAGPMTPLDDQVAGYEFQTVTQVDDIAPVTTGSNAFRCDSAQYLRFPGCVFPAVVDQFLLSVNSPARQEALHISLAQTRPDLTVPPVNGKNIPGSVNSHSPLTRTRDAAIRAANAAAAGAACLQFLAVPPSGFDCDEYPFAATAQGAGEAPSAFSVLYIPDADNSSGGGQLGGFYTNDRILAPSDIDMRPDSFFVTITN